MHHLLEKRQIQPTRTLPKSSFICLVDATVALVLLFSGKEIMLLGFLTSLGFDLARSL